MGSNPFNIGTEEKGSLGKTLFYFFREFKVNPFDEEYEVRDPKGKLVYRITKKGISLALFNELLEQMNEHYKRENEAKKRANRRR